jgi:phosphatidylglycerophosphate synthase
VGAIASGCFLVADVTWLALVRPPGLELLAGWFAAVALAGAFVPGVANQVSLARAHLAGPALVYTLLPARLVDLAAVVSLAGLTDLVDGRIARHFERPSQLGGALDPVVDGLFFGAVAVGLALGGAYPPWLAVVVVFRYAFPAVVGCALLVMGRRPKLEHTPLGQASTLLIGVMLGGLALLRGMGLPADGLVTLSEIILPVATLATFVNLFWSNRFAFVSSSESRR